MTSGELIRQYRLRRGMTQRELAEACRVDVSLITHLEADRRYPSATLLPVLAEVIHVDVDELAVLSAMVPLDLYDRLSTDLAALRVVRSALSAHDRG